MKVEPCNILKLFLNNSNFEPQYSYRLYSYKKKECMSLDIHKSMEKSANRGNAITLLEAKELIRIAYPKFLHCHGIGGVP